MSSLEATLEVARAPSATLVVGDAPSHVFGADEYVPYVPVMETYDGPYEVTPSSVAQTIVTTGLLMSADLVVNPIPSNYGLVTWDGATLTVS